MSVRFLCAYDIPVAIATDDEALFPLLDAQLPAFPDAGPDALPRLLYSVGRRRGDHRIAVVRGRRTIADSPTLSDASERLVADLQTALARLATDRTFIHAGVVAIDGRAILLPGRSGAGKTTLVAALLRRGAEYLSDEFAVVGSDGRVYPYSRPLALRVPGLPFSRVRAEQLSSRVCTQPVQGGALFFTEFQSTGPTPFEPLLPAHAALRLLPHCLGVRARTSQTLASLQTLTRHAAAFANTRGDADETAAALFERLRTAS